MKRVAILAFQDALATSMSLPMELLSAADNIERLRSRRNIIEIEIIGLDPPPIRLSNGMCIQVNRELDRASRYDIIIIPSRWRHPARNAPLSSNVQHWLRSNHQAGAAICAVGNGSYFLGEAGLLDHRPATTHWHYFDDFAQRYPLALLRRDFLITQDSNIYCTGSVNAAADLTVHLIDRYWGAATASRVAQQFSPESRRPFSRNTYRTDQQDLHSDEVIALAQSWLSRHLAEPLNIGRVAHTSGLSTRSFQRRFKTATTLTPQQYLQQLRLDLAQDLLQNSNLAIEELAQQCGYSDASYFCKLFKRETGSTPGAFRRAVRKKLFEVEHDQ